MMLEYSRLRPTKFTTCKCGEDETPTQPNLAVTPAQMMELTAQGIPVSTQNLGLSYDEGVPELEFTPALDQMRGIDMCTMWEHQQTSKKKLGSAYSKAKAAQPKTD